MGDTEWYKSKRGGGGGGGARNARQSGGGGGAQSLPSLEGTGSTKQVQWANDIRESAFKQLDLMESNIDLYRSRGLTADSLGYTKQDVATVRSSLRQTLSDPRAANAKFIIDHRSDISTRSIEQMVQSVGRQRKRR